MSVRVLSPEELEIQLNRLHNVLSSLPSSLPCSSNIYYFIGFGPDPNILELVGSVPVEGNEASAQSHTGEHLFRVLDEVLKTIGPIRFKGITSDNTGNTSLARVKTSQSLIISVRRSKIYRG
ncbi:hypothetical protein ACEPAI_6691 [Sanghuangporus weigelae]